MPKFQALGGWVQKIDKCDYKKIIPEILVVIDCIDNNILVVTLY